MHLIIVTAYTAVVTIKINGQETLKLSLLWPNYKMEFIVLIQINVHLHGHDTFKILNKILIKR